MQSVKRLNTFGLLAFLSLLTLPAVASLDLLAGVEAGIETQTAMTSTDLEVTQEVLSTQPPTSTYAWSNPVTEVAYQIHIKHSYSFGHYPCLSYELTITKDDYSDLKSLDACLHQTGRWISISPSSLPM